MQKRDKLAQSYEKRVRTLRLQTIVHVTCSRLHYLPGRPVALVKRMTLMQRTQKKKKIVF